MRMDKNFLVICDHNTKKLVRLKDILYFERISSKVFIHTVNDQISVSSTLSSIEEKLNDRNFYRTHRSFLVNLQNVKEVGIVGDRIYKINFIRGDKIAYISRERFPGFYELLCQNGIIF